MLHVGVRANWFGCCSAAHTPACESLAEGSSVDIGIKRRERQQGGPARTRTLQNLLFFYGYPRMFADHHYHYWIFEVKCVWQGDGNLAVMMRDGINTTVNATMQL